MAGLNPLYVIAPSLEMYFVDNASGLPLAGGTVNFYADDNRSNRKAVYELTGSSGNYSYVALPNPVTLSASGTFQDNSGNNILPYYWPWTGDPVSNPNPTVAQLYYIEVYNANGVLQFTRQGFPNFTAESSASSVDYINYVPNGQFLAHYNVNPANAVPGTITAVTTPIAPGGWYFEVSNNSATDVDVVTFSEFTTPPSSPPGTPHFAANVACTSIGGTPATFKYLALQFNDVNQFAGQTMQLGFWAQSNSGSSLTVNMSQVSNFGTGTNSPSTSTTLPIGQFTITTTYGLQQIAYTFPNNSSKVIGNAQPPTDNVQIVIAFPLSTLFNVSITDMIIAPNGTNITNYAVTTPDQVLSQAVAGYMPIPAPDGSDLYLPLRLTAKGLDFDHTQVGVIRSVIYSATYAATQSLPAFLCDGTGYVSSAYTTLGVPQSRLGSMLISDSPVANIPKYGTGLNYATAYAYAAPTSTFRVTVNSPGVAAVASDSGATGFSFVNTNAGTATINFSAYNNIANTVLCVGNFQPPPNGAVSNGTSGFTTATLDYDTGLLADQFYAFTVLCVAASALANPGGAGKYFVFSNASTTFYMWFFFTNETDPAPGGTSIKINLSNATTATAQDIANIVREAINAYQITSIKITTLPTAGTYFSFTANPISTKVYNVWYQVAGTGTAPTAPSGANIQVTLTGTETAAQAVTATLKAIDAYQYAVPDFRGMFLRGFDPLGTYDFDVAQRWSTISGLSGANLGTFEFDQFLQHAHQVNRNTNVATGGGSPITAWVPGTGFFVGLEGGSETRPVNAAVNFYINY